MKLKELLGTNRSGYLIDGTFYESDEVRFADEEMDTELQVVTMEDPDSWSLTYGKQVRIAQGIVDGHRFVARVE